MIKYWTKNSLKLFPIKIGGWLKSLICKYMSFWCDDAEKAHAGLVEGKQISTDQFLPFKVLGSFLQCIIKVRSVDPNKTYAQEKSVQDLIPKTCTQGSQGTGCLPDHVLPSPPSCLCPSIIKKMDGGFTTNNNQIPIQQETTNLPF